MGYSSKIQIDYAKYLPEINHDYLSLSKSKTVALQGTPDYQPRHCDIPTYAKVSILAAVLIGAGLGLGVSHVYKKWRCGRSKKKKDKETKRTEKILREINK